MTTNPAPAIGQTLYLLEIDRNYGIYLASQIHHQPLALACGQSISDGLYKAPFVEDIQTIHESAQAIHAASPDARVRWRGWVTREMLIRTIAQLGVSERQGDNALKIERGAIIVTAEKPLSLTDLIEQYNVRHDQSDNSLSQELVTMPEMSETNPASLRQAMRG